MDTAGAQGVLGVTVFTLVGAKRSLRILVGHTVNSKQSGYPFAAKNPSPERRAGPGVLGFCSQQRR
jgi:hypothetical protein